MGRIAGLCVLTALVVPATASASQVIGQTAPPEDGCFSSLTYVQVGLTSGAAYGTATRGVVTSWSTYGGSATGRLALVTMHPNLAGGAGAVTFDAKDVIRDVAPGALNTFSGVHLPIAAGGQIGLHVPFNAPGSCVFSVPAATDTYAFIIGNSNPGDAGTVGDTTGKGFSRVNASAVVEPDADVDGFGDETQDQCSTDPSTQGSCAVALTQTKKKKCKKKRHRRQSAGSAKKHKRCHKKHKR